MVIDLNEKNVIDFLRKKKFTPTLQPENQQIFIEIEAAGQKLPMFLGLISDKYVLQLVTYLPYHLYEESLGSMARFFHFLNKELDLPGFCMDEKSKLMFFRSVIPSIEGKIDDRYIDLYLKTTEVACETFMQAIESLVSGSSSIEDIVKKYE